MDPEQMQMAGGPAAMMGAPAAAPAPAAQMLPALAMLAPQQQAALDALQQQEMMMRDAMKQQILRLISMMPVANPAGVAARTEPMPPNMSPQDGGAMGREDDTSGEEPVEPANEMNTEYGNAG